MTLEIFSLSVHSSDLRILNNGLDDDDFFFFFCSSSQYINLEKIIPSLHQHAKELGHPLQSTF